MAKQGTQFRVVIRDGNSAGLYWHMEWQNEELYYGFSNKIGEVLRGSYHKSGINFFHIFQNKLRGIDKQSKRGKGNALELLLEPLRVTGASDSFANIKWGYKIKQDTSTRKTLVLGKEVFLDGFSPGVDLWAIPGEKTNLIDSVIEQYNKRQDVIFGTLVSYNQNPIFLVIVWGLSKGTKLAFETSIQKANIKNS